MKFYKVHDYAEKGELQKLKQELEKEIARGNGGVINLSAEEDDVKWTPLYFSVGKGHVDVVNYLIGEGANVSVHDVYSAICEEACLAGTENMAKYYEIIGILLRKNIAVLDAVVDRAQTLFDTIVYSGLELRQNVLQIIKEVDPSYHRLQELEESVAEDLEEDLEEKAKRASTEGPSVADLASTVGEHDGAAPIELTQEKCAPSTPVVQSGQLRNRRPWSDKTKEPSVAQKQSGSHQDDVPGVSSGGIMRSIFGGFGFGSGYQKIPGDTQGKQESPNVPKAKL